MTKYSCSSVRSIGICGTGRKSTRSMNSIVLFLFRIDDQSPLRWVGTTTSHTEKSPSRLNFRRRRVVRSRGWNISGDRHIYLTKYIHDSITRLTKSPAHYVRALTSSIVILDNAFSRRRGPRAAKRVVPPVLEFFRSFFAEEERERARRRRRIGTGEEVADEGGRSG